MYIRSETKSTAGDSVVTNIPITILRRRMLSKASSLPVAANDIPTTYVPKSTMATTVMVDVVPPRCMCIPQTAHGSSANTGMVSIESPEGGVYIIWFIRYCPDTTYGQGQIFEMHRVASAKVSPIEFNAARSLAPEPQDWHLLSREIIQFPQGKQPFAEQLADEPYPSSGPHKLLVPFIT